MLLQKALPISGSMQPQWSSDVAQSLMFAPRGKIWRSNWCQKGAGRQDCGPTTAQMQPSVATGTLNTKLHLLIGSILTTPSDVLEMPKVICLNSFSTKESKGTICSPSLGTCWGHCTTHSQGPPDPAWCFCCGCRGLPAAPYSFAIHQHCSQDPGPKRSSWGLTMEASCWWLC